MAAALAAPIAPDYSSLKTMAPSYVLYHQERNFRAQVIRHYLAAHGGNRSHTARALGIERTYLLRIMRQHGIK